MIEESIDQRNSMRLYRHYTEEEVFVPVTEYEMKQASKERDKLQKKHAQEHINLWEITE